MRTVNSANGVDPLVIKEAPEVGVVTGVTGTELPKTQNYIFGTTMFNHQLVLLEQKLHGRNGCKQL